MDLSSVKALGFDVFGTVVDWRGSVIREAQELGARKGIQADWAAFADEWRSLYGPSMEEVRSGRREWTKLDVLHRESLEKLRPKYGLQDLSEEELDHLNRAWHRLDPWPDAVPGLTRLRTRYTLFTMSNGNIALMVNMAKRAGLPWDAVLGAEPARAYKTQPEAYLRNAELLGLQPEQCMLVAAHPNDLAAAAAVGFKTGFVPRPEEKPNADFHPAPGQTFDAEGRDFLDFATNMGC